MFIVNREINTKTNRKTTDKNRNSEMHSLSSSSRSDLYAVINFTNKYKKKLKNNSHKGQRKTQKGKKCEEDAET